MSGRRRFLVALIVTGQQGLQVDGLRRGLSSPDLERIAPHITLVAPINVAEADVEDAVGLVRHAAAATRPLTLSLGSPARFPTRSDVVYLTVGGDLDELEVLRNRLAAAPLLPPASRDERSFLAHVTLSTRLEEERTHAALHSLAGYRALVRIDELSLLEQETAVQSHPWNVVAQFPFDTPVVVGRGGRELELGLTGLVDPPTERFLGGSGAPGDDSFVLVARDSSAIVGAVTGTRSGSIWQVNRFVVAEDRRNEGIGHTLLKELEAQVLASGADCLRIFVVDEAALRGFFERFGYVERNRLANWRDGEALYVMERFL